MKQLCGFFALVGLCCGLISPVSANQGLAISATVVQDTVKQLEIMAGDASGDLKLQNQVSRAEFATMLVAASPYKNVATSFGYTLFPDVPSSHWASGYVKVVVEQGYMVGYLDGTFGPSRTVLTEEAVTAVLNLLGYNSSSLSGTYPQAQLAKFYELDMDEFMTIQAGQAITREQCMYLFYNLMNTSCLDGTPYASKMGYALTATGQLDTMALTTSNTQGPFLVGTATLPTELSGVETIYKNNKAATLADMTHYDIIYYNKKLNTLWIYDEKVTGRLTEISSVQSPSAVTVAGISYGLETVDVIHKFSIGGDFQTGDLVTLLLGNQGQVADVIVAGETQGTYIGVVLARGVDQTPEGGDQSSLSNYIQIVTTDGTLRQFDSGTQKFEAGRVVQVTYDNGQQTIKGLSTKSVEGKINSSVTTLGNYKLSSDLEVFEISDDNYSEVYTSRLAGYTLKKEDVRYYETNGQGEIETLMLEDATGDLSTYALITDVIEMDYGMTKYGQYTYWSNGIPGMEVTDSTIYKIKRGAALFQYEDGVLDKMVQLSSGTVSNLSSLSALVGAKQYTLADQLQVYEKLGTSYQAVTLDQINDQSRYQITAYYDDGLYSAGGQVRILVAEQR